MGSTPKHEHRPNAAARLAQQARDAAQAGDRWLIGLAQDIAGLGMWAKTEANVVADSFVAALNTTVRLTKKSAGAGGSTEAAVNGATRPAATYAGVSDLDQSVITDGFLPETPEAPRSNQLDLLSATCDPASHSPNDGDSSVPAATYRAGVLPLLQALERILGEHAQSGHVALHDDTRFWKLIELIHLLKPPMKECAHDPHIECTRDTRGDMR